MRLLPKGFIEKNGYFEKGRTKKTKDTLLIRVAPSLIEKITAVEFEKIINFSRCKHVIVQFDKNAEMDEFDLAISGLLTVVDVVDGDRVYLSRGMIASGASKTVFSCSDNAKLLGEIEKTLVDFNPRHLKVDVYSVEDGIAVESLFFDEDRFEKLTMTIARAVAPFCPQVLAKYAYLPVQSDPKYAYCLSQTIKFDGYLPYPSLKKESYLPLVASREILVAEVGLERIAVTEENK